MLIENEGSVCMKIEALPGEALSWLICLINDYIWSDFTNIILGLFCFLSEGVYIWCASIMKPLLQENNCNICQKDFYLFFGLYSFWHFNKKICSVQNRSYTMYDPCILILQRHWTDRTLERLICLVFGSFCGWHYIYIALSTQVLEFHRVYLCMVGSVLGFLLKIIMSKTNVRLIWSILIYYGVSLGFFYE